MMLHTLLLAKMVFCYEINNLKSFNKKFLYQPEMKHINSNLPDEPWRIQNSPNYIITGTSVPFPNNTEDSKIENYEKEYQILPNKLEKWLKTSTNISINVATVAKILLSLIAFKKILKFLLILGFLLFAPNIKKTQDMYHTISKNDLNKNHFYHHVTIHVKNKKNKLNTSSTIEKSVDRAVVDREKFDVQRIKDLSIFLGQSVEAFTIKSLICYGVEDIFCRFYQLFENIDKIYSSRE